MYILNHISSMSIYKLGTATKLHTHIFMIFFDVDRITTHVCMSMQ